MKRYSASLLVQESAFHQLVAEFNKGKGIPRVSLAQEVAGVVADAMEAFSQVRGLLTVLSCTRENKSKTSSYTFGKCFFFFFFIACQSRAFCIKQQ